MRHERKAGSSKYSFKKMLKLAMAGILGFSGRPLTMIGYFGLLVGAAAVLGLIAAGIWGGAAWLKAVCILAILQAIIMVAQGIQGAYLNRIYDEVRGRPLYIIREDTRQEP